MLNNERSFDITNLSNLKEKNRYQKYHIIIFKEYLFIELVDILCSFSSKNNFLAIALK